MLMSERKTQPSAKADTPKPTGRLYTFALMTCAIALAGCTQQQHEAITGPISASDIGPAEAMEVAEDVLVKMHFTVEKADVASGYVRTRPLAGAQLFEFWRGDNVGSDNTLLANLHTIRRTVELNMTGQDGQLMIDCDVRVQRLSLPERELGSNARAYGMYTRSNPTLQQLKFDPAQVKAMAWIDLDKDTKLAAEILKRIERQIARRASDESQVTENQT
jgi:hypothetical protein